MLVLTRRRDESLVIDDNIVVTVLAIEGDKVKLGITAPRNISILRHELWQAMNEQRQIAEQLANKSEPEGFEELRKFLAEEEPSTKAGDEEPGKGSPKEE
jgi:carbon storage regulator